MSWKVTSTILLGVALLPSQLIAQKTSDVSSAFRKIQALAGEWEGKDDGGNPVKTNFQLVAGNTTVLETLTMSGMEEMLTLYSVDRDGIALVHYCPTNNQPRMRAVLPPGALTELVFSFQDATNLPDPLIGHEQKLVLQFTSADRIIERWTWRKNGKDTEMIFVFTRRPPEKR